MGEKFYKVSYNQGFCSLLGLGGFLKKKSQYPADELNIVTLLSCYTSLFSCYMSLLDTLFYRLQYVVENLIGVAEGDEIALKLRWAYVDATVKHVAEVAGETLLVALLGVLEVADRLVVEEHREHGAHVVHLDALAFYYLLQTGEEAVAALFEEFVNARFAQLLQGFITGSHCYRVTAQGSCLVNWAFWSQNAHDIGSTSEGCGRESATYYLSNCSHIRSDAESLLGTAIRETETGDDFIEDQGGAMLLGYLAGCLDKLAGRRHYAHVAGYRFDDERCYLVAILSEILLQSLGIIVGQHHGVLRETGWYSGRGCIVELGYG